MMRTGALLIGLLLLASAGCTRRDWVGDMLVLTDVTGTWAATFTDRQSTARMRFLMTLAQSGQGSPGKHRPRGDRLVRVPSLRGRWRAP
jgi:hypothetical protein